MEDEEVGRHWEENAEAWTVLSRKGYDVYRDALNTPAFLALLPDVAGRSGIDIGCGEGHNTRLVAQRGAKMCAVDIARTFIRFAEEEDARAPLGIEYRVASATSLPYADGRFDFAIATMSLMDVSDLAGALKETHRVLAPGGFFQFSILHPCFVPDHRKEVRDASGRSIAVTIAGYFDSVPGDIETWSFSAAPEEERSRFPPFRIPRFHRTLSVWVNALLRAGFAIEAIEEPRPSVETIARFPRLDHAGIAPFFLHARVRRG
jgi:ubiquinone/menaquinone biosynthesis C-methylase UbiE